MEEARAKTRTRMRPAVFSCINDDLLHNILSRLPAVSFAFAACVSTSWNRQCNRILSRPKLASAISVHPLPFVALDDAAEKVLREPIRPHFVIVNAGEGYDLYQALPIMAKKFGSRTPIVLSAAGGIIGKDAMTDEFKEVKYAPPVSDEDEQLVELNRGVMVTVGCVPGLVVDAIPLICNQTRRAVAIEEFLSDIRGFTASASGSTSPLGIMMFGASWVNQKSLIELLDYAMDGETVIVGHERDRMMLCRSSDNTRNVRLNAIDQPDSIALIFAKDRQKAPGTVDIQFHVALSNGLAPIGPIHKAVSVKERCPGSNVSTWLTAKREGERQILDGQQILDDIDDEVLGVFDN